MIVVSLSRYTETVEDAFSTMYYCTGNSLSFITFAFLTPLGKLLGHGLHGCLLLSVSILPSFVVSFGVCEVLWL